MSDPAPPPAPEIPHNVMARRVARAADRGYLSTLLVREPDVGWPYGSFVTHAYEQDFSPLLAVSQLSDHTRNLQADNRVSLLVEQTAGLEDPMSGPRLTIMGRAVELPKADSPSFARYKARHPYAFYADFPDFRLYRIEIEGGHYIGGFGRAIWFDAAKLTPPVAAELGEAEPSILEHMNGDHASAIEAYAVGLLAQPKGAWVLTGIDAEGIDLRLDGLFARLDFEHPISSADDAHRVLIDLAKRARRG